MLNPFARFQVKFVDGFRQLQKRWLVSQTFYRENHLFREEGKVYLMLTHYSDKGLAKIHHNAVLHDRYASIIDLENERHREKLLSMLTPGSNYRIYSSLVTDPKQVKMALDRTLKEGIQKFITTNTNWRIGREQTITPNLEITFGELYITMRYGTQQLRVKLEEIENC